ncbi:hypothetical protein AH06_52 [Erwinia phage AH06]|nr:hypothetical protein AH06_52 [Erwinia phage AH06]
MRTLIIILTEPSAQESIAVTIKDPYHELTFETIKNGLESATHRDVFRDRLGLLCNNYTLETLVDVIDEGDVPTMHFIYSGTEWSDWVKTLAKAFVYDAPHFRRYCSVKAAAALLTHVNPTLSNLHGDLCGIAYVEE